MNKVITVNNLVKTYRKAKSNAVDGISFDVEEGEFFSLLGPNGAGKTTTISILTTTLAKTSGEIKIGGYDLDKESKKVRQNIGIIFQNPSLDINLTAEENIRFHAILYGLYPFYPSYFLMPKSYKDQVEELSEIIGLKGEMFKPIKSFSGGMKRKLEIIRSLMHKPKILFLDEPSSGLDPLSRKNLWEYLQQIREKYHTTIFLTTHYLEEAEQSDKVCIINHGKIVSYGTASQIKKELVDEYLILESKQKDKLLAELDKLKLKYTNQGVLKVMVKAEDIQKTIQKIKTPLSNIETHTPTLEEAYIEIVEKGQKEDIYAGEQS